MIAERTQDPQCAECLTKVRLKWKNCAWKIRLKLQNHEKFIWRWKLPPEIRIRNKFENLISFFVGCFISFVWIYAENRNFYLQSKDSLLPYVERPSWQMRKFQKLIFIVNEAILINVWLWLWLWHSIRHPVHSAHSALHCIFPKMEWCSHSV